MKAVLEISELLEYIKKNKKIKFNNISEEKRMKELLEIYNYSNIFSLKYLYADGNIKIYNEDGKFRYGYSYKETDYRIIEKQYKKLLRMERKIREGVLMYEIELKTHFIFFLQDFLKIKNITFNEFLEKLTYYNLETKENEVVSEKFKRTLVEELNNHTKDFTIDMLNYSEYYYLLIKILSFGTIGKFLGHMYEGILVFTLFNNYLERYGKFYMGKQLKNLRTIITLRNSLCQKESLILFLEKGIKQNRKKNLERKKEKQFSKGLPPIDYLKLRIKAISDIYEYYYKRMKLNKKLTEESWIKSYRKLRLSNGKNGINFKKIKIDV